MAVGIWVAENHQVFARLIREFHAYFLSFTEEKSITNVLVRTMVKNCGVLQLQFIEVNGELVKRDAKLL